MFRRFFTVRPDGNLDLYPTPNSTTVVSAEYWRTPIVLSDIISPATTANANVSSIPARFHKNYYSES